MNMKRSITLLLSMLLMVALVVTGCSSSKETVFQDMKEANTITASRSTTSIRLAGNVTAAEDEDASDTDITLSFITTTDGNNSTIDLDFDYDGWAMVVEDFARVVDDTVYVRLGFYYEYLFNLFGLEYDDAQWLSIPLNEGYSAKYLTEMQSVSSELIDCLEKAFKGQTITKSDDGTWTSTLDSKAIQTIMGVFLEEVDKNISDWYDKYQSMAKDSLSPEFVAKLNTALNEAGASANDAWNDYIEEQESASTDDTTETTVSAEVDSQIDITSEEYLKAQKESFLKSWTDFYEEYKAADLSNSTGEGSLSFALTGEKGSRIVDSSFEMNTTGDEHMTASFSSHVEEGTGDGFSVSAPEASNTLDLDLVIADMVSIFGSTDEDNTDYEDNSSDETTGDLVEAASGEYALTEDEASAIAEQLTEAQVYIYDSDYEDLTPRTVTYDTSVLTAVDIIADYTVEFDINGLSGSYILFVYDMASSEEMTSFYQEQMDSDAIEESTVITNCGEVKVYTDHIYDEDNYGTYIFLLPVDDNATLSGFLYVNADEEAQVDVEKCIQALFTTIE